MNVQSILAILVIFVAVPAHWGVAFLLWRLSWVDPESVTLRERTLVAFALALIVTIFAAVFLNNGMAVPLLTLEQTQLLTRSAILGLSIPALYWLYLWWRLR